MLMTIDADRCTSPVALSAPATTWAAKDTAVLGAAADDEDLV